MKDDLQNNKQHPQSATKTKRRNYKKELEKATTTIQALQDQLLRKAAEFDNYKKRTEREFSDLVQNANAKLIADLLPVLDDQDRALDANDDNGQDYKAKYESLFEGSKLIRQKFFDILQSYGLVPMESINHEFDPEKHDALMRMKVKRKKSNVVVDEHLKGYELNGRVLRHAQVVVSE